MLHFAAKNYFKKVFFSISGRIRNISSMSQNISQICTASVSVYRMVLEVPWYTVFHLCIDVMFSSTIKDTSKLVFEIYVKQSLVTF